MASPAFNNWGPGDFRTASGKQTRTLAFPSTVPFRPWSTTAITEQPTLPRDGASELMRSLGLLVDGPGLWGKPVPARPPGVFVFEIGTPLAEAPIDSGAVRRWIEQVPSLKLDGEHKVRLEFDNARK